MNHDEQCGFAPSAMKSTRPRVSRRQFCASLAATGAAWPWMTSPALGDEADRDELSGKALVALTLDLEMSRNFPTWEETHWDYEKGNLDADTKRYTVEACRRVRARGHVIHCFCVGRVLEQEDVQWLKDIAAAGHPIGNHTYDHVNVKATKAEEIQFRFRRAPWLIRGQTAEQVIRENIRTTTIALKERCGITVRGFRTPGGFNNGLADRSDIQKLLLDQGFTWVSSKYPGHPLGKPGEPVAADVFEGIVRAQAEAQPFTYQSGLVEVPMNPISDVTAFRSGRWKLDDFLKALRLAVEWTIEKRAVFDLLCHPSCLVAMDPKFRAIDLVCGLVEAAKDRAAIVDLNAIAKRASPA
jgi:peptidoglycan/xylan/chitin deacetylase (PgdA/CDA1 family)